MLRSKMVSYVGLFVVGVTLGMLGMLLFLKYEEVSAFRNQVDGIVSARAAIEKSLSHACTMEHMEEAFTFNSILKDEKILNPTVDTWWWPNTIVEEQTLRLHNIEPITLSGDDVVNCVMGTVLGALE